jgi:hypothetical protein
MIQRPQQEDLIGGKIQIENYPSESIVLDEWTLSKVLDDILMCQYIDTNEDGTQIKRGSIFIPINVSTFAWRLAKVILSGPDCKTVKTGDVVMFPNDKGLQVANLNGMKNIVFLNENRIFGVCEPKT